MNVPNSLMSLPQPKIRCKKSYVYNNTENYRNIVPSGDKQTKQSDKIEETFDNISSPIDNDLVFETQHVEISNTNISINNSPNKEISVADSNSTSPFSFMLTEKKKKKKKNTVKK